VVITRNAQDTLDPQSVQKALQRHTTGDWGIVSDDDRIANDEALKDGERILSAYKDSTGVKFWIITEWDRSYTTVLLPDDY
jgi:hypothetical protein